MGNCCSSGPPPEENDLTHKKSARAHNWQRTGVISARDANLKVAWGAGVARRGRDAWQSCLCEAVKRVTMKRKAASPRVQDWPAIESLAATARVLDCTNNRLDYWPDWLARFTTLQRLILSRNEFTVLPTSIGALTNLRVGSCALARPPRPWAAVAAAGLAAPQLLEMLTYPVLVTMQVFMLDSNGIAELPESIGLLVSGSTPGARPPTRWSATCLTQVCST